MRSSGEVAEVAIKELAISRARSLKAVDLFERESRVLGTLSHPGIPAFIEEATVEGPGVVNLYLVQELIAGSPLQLGAGDERDTVRIIAEIADILVYLHSRRPPIIHRDIKPSNVMMRPDGSIALIDFGSVRHAVVDAAMGGSTVAGTFGYMAPEQLRGHATAASDLYSVGALAVALLAGRDAAALVDPIRPDSWRGHVAVSHELGALLTRLLEPNDTKRLSNASVLAAEARLLLAQPNLEPVASADDEDLYPLPAVLSLEMTTDRTIDAVLVKEQRAFRRGEWLEQFRPRGLSSNPLPAVGMAVLAIFGTRVLNQAFQTHLGTLGGLGLFVLGAGAWLGWVRYARLTAKRRHDFYGDPLPSAILEHWRGQEDFEAQGLAMIAQGKAPRDFDRPILRQLHQAWATDLRRVPLLEAEAAAFFRTKQYSVAANLLENAVAIGVEILGSEHILVQTQRRRYAALMFASPGHADMARTVRLRADDALTRREDAQGEPVEAMVQMALQSLRQREPGVRRAPSTPTKAVRKFKVRAFVNRWLPGHRQWKRVFFVGFLGAIVSVPVAALVYAVVSQSGIADFSEIVLFMMTLLVGLPVLGSLLPREGMVPARWQSLYPRLDLAWPLGHWGRPLLYEALPTIFRDPLTDRAGTGAAISRLKKAMGVSRPEMALVAKGSGASFSGLDAIQTVYLEELETLRTWHAEGLFAHVATLENIPVDDANRRALFFEILAERALDEKLPDLAARALGQAERLRRAAFVD